MDSLKIIEKFLPNLKPRVEWGSESQTSKYQTSKYQTSKYRIHSKSGQIDFRFWNGMTVGIQDRL
jgi:hypothetical protein